MYEAYVDGSFLEGRVGYGAVLLSDGEVVQEFSGSVAEDTQSRQVAGELVAVITVMEYCKEHGINEIKIYYDYNGIEKWARGQWKTNTSLTQRYAEYMSQCPVTVRWQKVKSHSGVKWNEAADELAKQGAGLGEAVAPGTKQIQLENLAQKFVDYLAKQGIQAAFTGVYNEQYARLEVQRGEQRAGFFDLYNTKNRPLVPYLHGFKDKSLQARISQYWDEYKQREVS